MKIQIQNPDLIPIQKEGRQKGPSSVEGGEPFSAILERVSSAGDIMPACGAGPACGPMGPSFTTNQQMALDSAGRTLGLLDNMENSLIKDKYGSSMIGDISSMLEEEVERLKVHRDSLEPGDPLREHLDAIGARAHAESEKVKRGDYTA